MNISSLKPIGDNVLIEVIKTEKIGRFHLPQERGTSEWAPISAKVLAKGTSKKIEVAVDNTVIVSRLSGRVIETEDREKIYKMVSSADILCIVGE